MVFFTDFSSVVLVVMCYTMYLYMCYNCTTVSVSLRRNKIDCASNPCQPFSLTCFGFVCSFFLDIARYYTRVQDSR